MTESTQVIRRPQPGPMGRLVRIIVIAVAAGLGLSSTVYVVSGERDLGVLFALAAPLGISAWGFARAGMYQAALTLLSGVLVAVASVKLAISPLGMHDHAVLLYAGVVLFTALLLSRKSFIVMAAITLLASTAVFLLQAYGLTRSAVGAFSGWRTYFDFILVIGLIGVLGRIVAESLIGSVGDAQQSTIKDALTGLSNRNRFLATLANRLSSADSDSFGVLMLADIDNFRRVNHVVGHEGGDRFLAEVARRVAAFSPGALAGRMGDDELGLFVLDLASADEAEALARRLAADLTFQFAGVSVRATVGCAVHPRDGDGAEALLLAADNALANARKQR